MFRLDGGEIMAVGLNLKEPYRQYQKVYNSDYFVDKSEILEEIVPLLNTEACYVCVTRPRRFGKTLIAQLLAAYFTKNMASSKIFDTLKVRNQPFYKEELNQHNVIYIDFSNMPRQCSEYEQYENYHQEKIIKAVARAYPDILAEEQDAVWDVLDNVFEETGDQFIFIIDEWDALFQMPWCSEKNRECFILFLSNLLKNKGYIEFVFMTGVLPIRKYSSGSALNMFYEYSAAQTEKYGRYFGFTHEEVQMLYTKYVNICQMKGIKPKVELKNLIFWYDGYQTMEGKQIYNPRSIVRALNDNKIGNYWTETGPFNEVINCIQNNIDAVREDIVRMVAGEAIEADIQEYAANQMKMTSRNEILSAMVVYGFLSCKGNLVCIPNKELMEKFEQALHYKEMGYVYRLAKESQRMLTATLNGDTDTMEDILSTAHNTEIPVLRYNDEGDLASLVNLIYLAARDHYDVRREENTGKGRADVLFYPHDLTKTGIIIELKVDDTPENAIQQIKEKQYAQRFFGGIADKRRYTGEILAVGMVYNSKTKEHHCKVEVL